jgi:cytidine deaminase
VLADGEVHTGANVENASYSVTICAERVAAAAAVAAGHRGIEAVAIVGPREEPVAPCGTCRQFLSEFNPSMVVVSEGGSGERLLEPLSALLPEAFGPRDLA